MLDKNRFLESWSYAEKYLNKKLTTMMFLLNLKKYINSVKKIKIMLIIYMA